MRFFCAVLLSLAACSCLRAEDARLASLFAARGITGTLVISSLDGSVRYVHNDARARQRFLPASTFKIPNTLIALSEGKIRDENEIIPWDGKDKGREEWNKDHSLTTAFPVSCVWFYQELARRVGNAAYLRHLERLGYGNRKTGSRVDTFWLDGDLRISAEEQIAFLKRLYLNRLPYKARHIRALKKIMTVESGRRYTVLAKTGMTEQPAGEGPAKGRGLIGWYVGYVELPESAYFFAANMDLPSSAEARYRREIVDEALRLKAIVPDETGGADGR